MKRSPVRRRRETPRRGRVIDEAFMEFARSLGCILKDKHHCEGPMTFHHVRAFGSPKCDDHGVGLCSGAHLHGWSPYSIEAMGKSAWQGHWYVDLEQEIARIRALFAVRPADKQEA